MGENCSEQNQVTLLLLIHLNRTRKPGDENFFLAYTLFLIAIMWYIYLVISNLIDKLDLRGTSIDGG